VQREVAEIPRFSLLTPDISLKLVVSVESAVGNGTGRAQSPPPTWYKGGLPFSSESCLLQLLSVSHKLANLSIA
jgi:hypothetical protein